MTPPAKICSGKFSKNWIYVVLGARIRGFIVESKLGEQFARCILCSHDVKVMASGVFDVDHCQCHWHCKCKLVSFSLMVD